jgi:hypothetical protein
MTEYQSLLITMFGPAPSIDQQWIAIRVYRNMLLASCDWTQLQDAQLSMAQIETWMEYRQVLRDIPNNTDDPGDITWPELPE